MAKAKRSGKRIRTASAAAIATRYDDQLRVAVNDVGASIGLPDAQRGHHAVAIVPTAVDAAARPLERTLRKLTRAERLLRSGAIDKHQAAAIDLYIAAADVAYATCMRASSLGEGGGSSPTGAAAAAHGRQLERAYDADRYQRARAALPPMHIVAFERIVLENHALGQVGSTLWPGKSKATVSGAVRQMVAQCADALCIAFERELGVREDLRGHLAKTMARFDAAVRIEQDRTAAATPVWDAIARGVQLARPGDVLLLAPQTAADLQRELGTDAVPGDVLGHAAIVVERWRWGWLFQAPA